MSEQQGPADGPSLGDTAASAAADHLGPSPLGNNPDRLEVKPRALSGASSDVHHLLATQRAEFFQRNLDALSGKTEAHSEAIAKVQTSIGMLEERMKHVALREEVSSTKNTWLVSLWSVLLIAVAAASFMPTIWKAVFDTSIMLLAPPNSPGPASRTAP